MSSLEPAGVQGTEFDAPQADRLPGNDDPALGQQIFNIPVAQIESVVEPDCVGDDVGWESVAFVGIHSPILPICPGELVSTPESTNYVLSTRWGSLRLDRIPIIRAMKNVGFPSILKRRRSRFETQALHRSTDQFDLEAT